MSKRNKSLKKVEERINSILGIGFKVFAVVLILGAMGACFGILPLDDNSEQHKEVNYNPSNDPRIDEMYQSEIEHYEKQRYIDDMREDALDTPVHYYH